MALLKGSSGEPIDDSSTRDSQLTPRSSIDRNNIKRLPSSFAASYLSLIVLWTISGSELQFVLYDVQFVPTRPGGPPIS
jgi:hypothetical protein